MSRLVLGTAQWGNPYGVTNARGRLSDSDISEIVQVAHGRGISDVDTAQGYGDSEARLRPFASDFAVTTKISGSDDAVTQVESSLTELGISRLDSVLVHDWESLDAGSRVSVVHGLGQARDAALVERVGVSIYGQAGIESAIGLFAAGDVEMDALQVPANPIDRRLDGSSLLMDLHASGAHITVRSAFLQGVLLSDFGRWADHEDVRAFRNWVADSGAPPLGACLGHVRALPWASHVVVGVTSAQELTEVCDAWDSCEVGLLPEALASNDLELIDPRRW